MTAPTRASARTIIHCLALAAMLLLSGCGGAAMQKTLDMPQAELIESKTGTTENRTEKEARKRDVSAKGAGADLGTKELPHGMRPPQDQIEAHRDVETLSAEIQRQTHSYREEFGVEDASSDAPKSCEEVCDLSEAICKSSKKICEFALVHPSEAYFTDQCTWSDKECQRSAEQCEGCSR